MRRLWIAPLLVFLMGHDHGGGCGGDSGTPTESTCDPRLTYDNFGRAFMAAYCTKCHASDVSGGQRRGAPEDHDYDTIEGVQEDPTHVDLASAAGPAGKNTRMPPYGAMPTDLEREQLGQWLACGAP
jgi:uncharacterized membrane protein